MSKSPSKTVVTAPEARFCRQCGMPLQDATQSADESASPLYNCASFQLIKRTTDELKSDGSKPAHLPFLGKWNQQRLVNGSSAQRMLKVVANQSGGQGRTRRANGTQRSLSSAYAAWRCPFQCLNARMTEDERTVVA